MTTLHLIYAILALQVADAASTVYFLKNTTLTEANPILRKLFEIADPLVVLLVLKGIFAVLLWTFQTHLAVEALYLVIAVYVAVVVNNIRLIRK